jgi:hypothetical protein
MTGAIMAVVGFTWFFGDLNHQRALLFGPPLSTVGIAMCAQALSSGRSALVAVLLNISAGLLVTVAGVFQWAVAGWGLAWEPNNSTLQSTTGVGLLLTVVGIVLSIRALRRIP